MRGVAGARDHASQRLTQLLRLHHRPKSAYWTTRFWREVGLCSLHLRPLIPCCPLGMWSFLALVRVLPPVFQFVALFARLFSLSALPNRLFVRHHRLSVAFCLLGVLFHRPWEHFHSLPARKSSKERAAGECKCSPGENYCSPSELGSSPSEWECSPSELGSSPSELGSPPGKLGSSPSELGSSPGKLGSSPSKLESSPTNLEPQKLTGRGRSAWVGA